MINWLISYRNCGRNGSCGEGFEGGEGLDPSVRGSMEVSRFFFLINLQIDSSLINSMFVSRTYHLTYILNTQSISTSGIEHTILSCVIFHNVAL